MNEIMGLRLSILLPKSILTKYGSVIHTTSSNAPIFSIRRKRKKTMTIETVILMLSTKCTTKTMEKSAQRFQKTDK